MPRCWTSDFAPENARQYQIHQVPQLRGSVIDNNVDLSSPWRVSVRTWHVTVTVVPADAARETIVFYHELPALVQTLNNAALNNTVPLMSLEPKATTNMWQPSFDRHPAA